MKKLSILAILAAVVFAGCNNQSNTPKELKGISLNKQVLEMEMGETQQLIVLYDPEDAEDGAPAVSWQCTKDRVASVTQSGRVEAKQKGRATIIATCGRFTAECKLEVVTGTTPIVPPPSDKFSVSPKEIKATADGGTFTINVKANIAWSAACEDDTWASISPDSGDGDATITVTVQPNTEETTDEQDIIFNAGEYTEYVTIRRDGFKKLEPITLDKKEEQVQVGGGEFTVNVTSEIPWEVKCEDSRVSFTKSGSSVKVTVGKSTYDGWSGYNEKDNPGEEIPVTFSNGDNNVTFTIKQKYPYIHRVITGSDSEWIAYCWDKAESHTFTTQVYSNIPWKVVFKYDNVSTAGKDWASSSVVSGNGDGAFVVTFQQNTTGSSQDGYCYLDADDGYKCKQSGGAANMHHGWN